jgi:hypothetical protein
VGNTAKEESRAQNPKAKPEQKVLVPCVRFFAPERVGVRESSRCLTPRTATVFLTAANTPKQQVTSQPPRICLSNHVRRPRCWPHSMMARRECSGLAASSGHNELLQYERFVRAAYSPQSLRSLNCTFDVGELSEDGPCVVFSIVERCVGDEPPLGGASFRVVADSDQCRTRVLCNVASNEDGQYRVYCARPPAGGIKVDVHLGWTAYRAWFNDEPGGSVVGFMFGNATNGIRTPLMSHLAHRQWVPQDRFVRVEGSAGLCSKRAGAAWVRTVANASSRRLAWWQSVWHWEEPHKSAARDLCSARVADGEAISEAEGGTRGRAADTTEGGTRGRADDTAVDGKCDGGVLRRDLLSSSVTSIDVIGESHLQYMLECLADTLYAGRVRGVQHLGKGRFETHTSAKSGATPGSEGDTESWATDGALAASRGHPRLTQCPPSHCLQCPLPTDGEAPTAHTVPTLPLPSVPTAH